MFRSYSLRRLVTANSPCRDRSRHTSRTSTTSPRSLSGSRVKTAKVRLEAMNLTRSRVAIVTGRDLAAYVHADHICEAFYNATLRLYGNGAPQNAGIYIKLTKQAAFSTSQQRGVEVLFRSMCRKKFRFDLPPATLAVLRSSPNLEPCRRFRTANIVRFIEHVKAQRCQQCLAFFRQLDKETRMIRFLCERKN